MIERAPAPAAPRPRWRAAGAMRRATAGIRHPADWGAAFRSAMRNPAVVLARRLVWSGGRFGATLALTLFGLLLVTFLIGRAVPVDPALTLAGDRASAETHAAARLALGLDRPLWEQFGRHVGAVLGGDLGVSTLTANPVAEDLARAFPATLELAILATLIGILGGVPLGVLAALHHGRWPDRLARAIGLLGYSVPIFWLGLMALLVFYAWLGWLPGPGRLDPVWEGLVEPVTGLLLIDSLRAGEPEVFANALGHLILPAATLGYFSLATLSRLTRSFMLEQLRQDYILTARAKGLSEARVLWQHALPNILVPLATAIALAFANLLEGSVLTETVFAWPGLGQYLTHALMNADMNAILGATLLIGALFVTLNLLSDRLHLLLDPRLGARP